MFQLKSNNSNHAKPHMMKDINKNYLLQRIKLLEYIDRSSKTNKTTNNNNMYYYFWFVNVNMKDCFYAHVKTINEIDQKIYIHEKINIQESIKKHKHRNDVFTKSSNRIDEKVQRSRRRNILQINKTSSDEDNNATDEKKSNIYNDNFTEEDNDGDDDDDDVLPPLITLKRKKHAAMKGITTFFELMGKDRHGHGSVMSQKAIDAKNQRQMYLTMMEISDKSFEMSATGIKTKEVYSMVIDKIMNRLPEIMTQVLISILRKPFIHFGGQFMQANTPGMIAPNSEDTPEVPVIANIPGTSSMPPPKKKKCEKAGKPPPGETFAPGANPHALAFLDDCEKEVAGGKHAGDGRTGKSYSKQFQSDKTENSKLFPSLVESKSTSNVKSNVNHYHNHRMHQGGEQGGPVARVMPIMRQTIMHGLATHVIPYLQDEITVRVTNRFDVVQNSVLRNVVRWIAPTLTAAISSKSIGATIGKTYKQTLEKTNKKTAFLITKQLTLALSEAITLSMTHQPRSDYYCHYCDADKIYCEYCKFIRKSQTDYGYYANYFAGYFGHYYAKEYGGELAMHFIKMSTRQMSS
jgi:hypothetical protein